MQNVPYTPGSYFARVDYSVPETVTKAYGNLIVQILDANGKVLNLRQIVLPSTNISFNATKDSTVAVPFTLPADVEKAATVRFMLLMDGLNPDKKVLVKNAGIYRLE
jgi:hypothetical protein